MRAWARWLACSAALSGAALYGATLQEATAPALSAYRPQQAVAGRLVCAGAGTMEGVMDGWSRGFNARQPAAEIVVERGDKLSADGFAELLEGRAQLVTFVREAFPAELAAFQRRFGYPLTLVAVGGGSVATKSGTHAIAVYVNAANPLAQMSLAQLDGVFSAARRRGSEPLTHWGQLGLTGDWADRAIVPYGMLQRRTTGNPPGIVNFVMQRVLLGGDFGPQVKEVIDRPGEPSLDGIVHHVAGDVGGIGYSGFAYAAPGTKTLALAQGNSGPYWRGTAAEVADRRYPLSRQIYLGFNRPPGKPLDPLTAEFIRFVLSRDGQEGLRPNRMNFLPLSAAQADTEARTTLTEESRPIAIVGYNDMSGMIAALDELYRESHPGATFELSLKGTRTAPGALASGRSAFAPMGAEFSGAELAEYCALAGIEPVPIQVAHASLNPAALSGPIGIYVPRDNPVGQLSANQVAAIFTRAKPPTWGELGLSGKWGNQPVVPIGLGATTALGLYMQHHHFGGRPFSPAATGLPQSAAVVAAVGHQPFALGFASANRLTPEVKLLAIVPAGGGAPVACTPQTVQAGLYPYDRHLLLYLRRDHAGAVTPVADAYVRLALSPAGQHAIGAAHPGYLPLNPSEIGVELARLDSLKP